MVALIGNSCLDKQSRAESVKEVFLAPVFFFQMSIKNVTFLDLARLSMGDEFRLVLTPCMYDVTIDIYYMQKKDVTVTIV